MEKEKQKTGEKTNRKKKPDSTQEETHRRDTKTRQPNPSLVMGRPGNMIPRAALR
jgi:hypothetical protein